MNRMQIRRTTTPGYAPTIADLWEAELAVNLVDKNMYIRVGDEVVDLSAASSIKTDATHRFVTDSQIAAWNTPYSLPVADGTTLGGVKVGSNIIVEADGTIRLEIADTATNGLLSATDWNTFNNKQAALGFTPVNKAGDTMLGALVLNADPVDAMDAVTKQYADMITTNSVAKSGDTMTGPLLLSGDPSQSLGAVPKQYVDNAVNLISGRYAAPVQTLVELTALAEATLVDKQMRLVEDKGAIYRYDTASTETVDGDGVLAPDDVGAAGRWLKVQAATQSHNNLVGLQGGAAGDFLHITTAEKNAYDTHLNDADKHLTSVQNDWIDAINASAQELNYLIGVTGSIQDQIDGKQDSLGYTAVNKAGDTMLGMLSLFADPSAPMHAVNLSYLQSYTVDGGVF